MSEPGRHAGSDGDAAIDGKLKPLVSTRPNGQRVSVELSKPTTTREQRGKE